MSEVQSAEDAVKLSGPPSPAQDALEAESMFMVASQPSGDAPEMVPESSTEPKALKAETAPTQEPPTNGVHGEKPKSQMQTKQDSPAEKVPSKPVSDVSTTRPDEEKPGPEHKPALTPMTEPDIERESPKSARAAEPDAGTSPGLAAAAKPNLFETSADQAAAAEPAVEKASPEASRDSPPPADSGQDDSGCDMEPEPLPAGPASMAESSGPAMADVEQLARSVVTDTLERAKQEANMQRQLDNRKKDPDVDDDGWLDVVGNGQLKKKVITPGSGDRGSRPQRSQVVTVHLSAHFKDGRPATGLPERLTFGLGDGEVITGLDMAVGLMQPGETAEVFMDARFAYGEKGLDDIIPPDASLTFTVQLEDVKPEPKYEEMSAEERLATGSQKRDRGNWWFKRDDFNHAIQCYRRALDFFDNESDEFTGLPDDVHVLFEERLKVHNNMAAAQMKLEAYDAALRSVQLVLTCQPDNVKALYRKGKILVAQKKIPEAAEALKEALSHSPDNRTVQAELHKVLAEQRRQAEEQKSLYRKMLGLPPAEDKPAPTAPAKSFPVKLLVCGVACALAAVAVSRMKLF